MASPAFLATKDGTQTMKSGTRLTLSQSGWTCQCGNLNFSGRTRCNLKKCGLPREASDPALAYLQKHDIDTSPAPAPTRPIGPAERGQAHPSVVYETKPATPTEAHDQFQQPYPHAHHHYAYYHPPYVPHPAWSQPTGYEQSTQSTGYEQTTGWEAYHNHYYPHYPVYPDWAHYSPHGHAQWPHCAAASSATQVPPTMPGHPLPAVDPPQSDDRKLFVGGLPAGSSKEEVWDVFAKHGTLLDVYMLAPKGEDNNRRACAFITFESKDQSYAAMAALRGKKDVMPGAGGALVIRIADPPMAKQES